jgi:putative ABC transport system substrate-binding protein
MGLATGRAPLRTGVILVILGILCVLLTAEAQQATKVHRVGLLHPFFPPPPSESDSRVEAFRQGLHDLGYVEGQNLVIEIRYAEGSEERLRDLAAELGRLKVDVIVAVASAATRAAQHATRTIPIVMAGTYDPVAQGFVASLAHPGGEHHGLELPGRGTPREAAGDPQGDGAPEHAHRRVGQSGLSSV